MKKQRLPKGWTQAQIRQLAEHHDSLTEDQQASETDAVLDQKSQPVLVVPTECVPEIVNLINKKRPA